MMKFKDVTNMTTKQFIKRFSIDMSNVEKIGQLTTTDIVLYFKNKKHKLIELPYSIQLTTK